MGNKNDNRLIYITHKAELLIWLIIILFVVMFSLLFYYTKVKPSANVYRIYLPDIDGLIVGSTVRMMGIEVGHVNKIKPMKDEVYVRFVLKDKDMKIPQGTIATVEFNGMAGSKSLELYLPEEGQYIDKNTPILSTNSPKRLSDSMGLLNYMFKEFNDIIVVSSNFSKELKKIELPKNNSDGNLTEFVNYADKMIDNTNERLNELGRKINYDRK